MSQQDHKLLIGSLGLGQKARKQASTSKDGQTKVVVNKPRSSGSSGGRPAKPRARDGRSGGHQKKNLNPVAERIRKLEKALKSLDREGKFKGLYQPPKRSDPIRGSTKAQPTALPPRSTVQSRDCMDSGSKGEKKLPSKPEPVQKLKQDPGTTTSVVPCGTSIRRQTVKRRAPPIPVKVAPVGAHNVNQKVSVDTQTESTATSVKRKRNLPRTAGSSLRASLHPSENDSELPLYSSQPIGIKIPNRKVGGMDTITGQPRLKLSVMPATRNIEKVQVDHDLYGFLIYSFIFVPRTPELFLQMAAKAKNWLKDFDTTDYTHAQLHERIVRAVNAAMIVPSEEIRSLSLLQERVSVKQRHDHANMVGSGMLGSILEPAFCFFGRQTNVSLPRKPS